MGNFQSVFYPDNPNRRKRVQQLSDDCSDSKQKYNATKTKLVNELGPYKDKLENVLKALDCTNIADLDELVKSSMSGDDLEHWNQMIKTYDDSQVVDDIFMGVQGVILVGGLVISAIGALAGGIGFFAGLGITMEIEMILGAAQILFDLINGAVQREKMRDAINALVPCRLKARFVQEQMDELYRCVPAIKALYDIFEKAGYDKDEIIKLMKDANVAKSLQQHTKKITYEEVGQELLEMDSGRGSWTNEDPDWHPIATDLEKDYQKRIAKVDRTPLGPSKEAQKVREPWVGPYLPYDGEISMRFMHERTVEILQQPLHILLRDFDSTQTARVRINTSDDSKTLVADLSALTVDMKDSGTVPDTESTHWVLSFVHPEDGPRFSTVGKDWDPSKTSPKEVEIYIRVNVPGLPLEDFPYLAKAGALMGYCDKSAAHLVTAYT